MPPPWTWRSPPARWLVRFELRRRSPLHRCLDLELSDPELPVSKLPVSELPVSKLPVSELLYPESSKPELKHSLEYALLSLLVLRLLKLSSLPPSVGLKLPSLSLRGS